MFFGKAQRVVHLVVSGEPQGECNWRVLASLKKSAVGRFLFFCQFSWIFLIMKTCMVYNTLVTLYKQIRSITIYYI